MPSIYSRRHFLRAALLSGGVFTAAALTPALLPLAARAGGLLPGGAPAEPLRQTSLFMGTMVSISVAQAEPGRAEEGMARAFALGRRMADVFTRFDASSPVGALNAHGALPDAPPELNALLQRAARVGRLTGGSFDVTVLPLLRLLDAHRNPTGSLRLA